ncbi:protein kinase domain-containing protein, partial [Streptomyces boluensis]
APAPAAPNTALRFEAYDDEPDGTASLPPLPVLEPTATWLAHWAQLVADAGGRQLPGAVARLGPPAGVHGAHGDVSGADQADLLTPTELVQRFRSLASPEAFRLAGHLAVGRPELPVMRLVQAAVEPHPRPQHLAEVILSGVLTTTPSAPPGTYTFRPGVRELLLHTLPRTAQGRTTQLLSRIGGLIDARAGIAAGDFPAVTPGPGTGHAAPEGEAFATVREESVRRLGGVSGSGALVGGRYEVGQPAAQALGRNDKYWSARDVHTGETVVLRLGDRDLSGWPSELPSHPSLVRVLDVGLHNGSPYMAMEHVDGPDLASYRTNARGVEEIATQLLDALMTLHDAGLVHGRLVPENILIAPDGTPKISGFALHDRPGKSRNGDLRALGRILADLADSQRWDHFVDMSANFRSLLRELESGRAGAGWGLLLPQQYRPLGPVGLSGTMWRAHNDADGQEVLVQRFPHIGDDERHDVAARARALAELAHPNVARVIEWGDNPVHGGPYLVTELVRGFSLKELLSRSVLGGLPPARFLPIARALALTVSALHDEGIPHGDLTAAHIMVSDSGRTTLCGFDLGATGEPALRDDLRRVGGHVQAMATGARPTNASVMSHQLASAPAAWRVELASILNDLRFGQNRAWGALHELAALGNRALPHDRTARLYRLFGQVRIEEGRTQTTIERPGSVEEAVFCALLLRPGEHLTYEELLAQADVEPNGTPAEVRLRGCVALLRRELGDDVLGRTSEGLVLQLLDGDTTDVLRVEELDAAARRAREAGDLDESQRLMRRACDLTRDDPLPGVRGPFAPDTRERLRALAVTVRLTMAELDLAQGDFTRASADLKEFLTRYPGNPQAVRLLMVALRGLGRREQAVAVYQEYEDGLPSPIRVDPAVRRVFREIRESIDAHEARLLVEFTTPADEQAHQALGTLLTRILEGADTVRVSARVTEHPTAEGHEVVVTAVEPRPFLLRTALGQLGEIHREIHRGRPDGGPPLRALMGVRPDDVREAWAEQVRAPLALGLSDELYQSLIVRSRLADPRLFRPLTGTGRGDTPSAWYCVWRAPDPSADRAEHHFTLPSSDNSRPFTAHVEFRWRYPGPQRADGREADELTDAFRESAARITRQHPPGAAPAALRQLRKELRSPKSPRVTAQHGILSLTAAPPGRALATSPLTEATTVLLGFDGPLTRLYQGNTAATVTRQLTLLVTELRDVDETLRGDPVVPRLSEGTVHPLDVLRTYADHPVGADLNRQLTGIEASRPTRAHPAGQRLLRALQDSGRTVAVVSDTSRDVMLDWLDNRSLPVPGGVFGRSDDLSELMSDPAGLRRALHATGTPVAAAVMVGSSPAEFEAASALGLTFVGYAYDTAVRTRLREAGCELIVDSLDVLLDFDPST